MGTRRLPARPGRLAVFDAPRRGGGGPARHGQHRAGGQPVHHQERVGGGEIYFDEVLVRKDGRFVLPELEGLNPENLL